MQQIGMAMLAFAAIAQPVQQYRVSWTAATFPTAHVRAVLSSDDCTFGTAAKWSDFFPGTNGWSQFIHDLSATDLDGHPLSVAELPNGRWKVGSSEATACRVKLRYSVDYAFGRRQWQPGNEQVAYTTASAVYSTGLSLFVLGKEAPALVDVAVPKGWIFATPWQPAASSQYRVATQDSLLNNTFVAGRTFVRSFQGDRFKLTVALLGHPVSSADQVRIAFAKLAPSLVHVFGDGRNGRYMIVLLRGPEDGESYVDSFAVSTEHALSADNRIVWGNHLAHELTHYWIGQAIAPSSDNDDALKWFTEGFTEYLANRALLETRIIDPAEFRELMAHHMSNYLLTRENPFFMNTSLQDAGGKAWSNRPLIYSGGAVFAFCLDERIRKDSNRRKDLSTAMRDLFNEAEDGQKLSTAGIFSALAAADGSDLGTEYRKYVEGTATLPVEQCAADGGFHALVHGYDVFLRAGP